MTSVSWFGAIAAAFLGVACHSKATTGPSTPEPPAASTLREESLLCGSNAPERADVVKFDLQTTGRPKPVVMNPPLLTREAKAKGLEGLVALKCVITKTGAVEDCCVFRGVNGLNAMVFDAVSTWRYEPVLVQGKPVNLSYIINVKILVGKKDVVPAPPMVPLTH